MKKQSKWAKNNPAKSRIIIAFCHVFAVLNALSFGIFLFILDWGYSKWSLVFVAIVFFLSYFFYPEKGNDRGWFQHSYTRQKSHDFILVVSYSLMITLGLNNFLTIKNQNYDLIKPSAKLVVHKGYQDKELKISKSFKSQFKEKTRHLRKRIKAELRELKKELKKQGDKAGVILVKFFLILLTIGVALFLAKYIAALSCSLSCSGDEGLAAMVAIFGLAGIILLSTIAIKNILRKVGRKGEFAHKT